MIISKQIGTLSFIMLVCQLAFGQHKIVGYVADGNSNIGLPGASLKLKKKGLHTKTNDEGHYVIDAPLVGDTLMCSYLGYKTALYPIKDINNGVLNIAMEPETGVLNEVVVNTGFYTIPRERSTGSFSQVDNNLLNRSVSPDLFSRLEGITNGLQFNRSNIKDENRLNQKTELRIRGLSTIEASSSPLIVVDNFPYNGDLATINPNDIESVTILKDAAAASIWGALAANGVIVINTKQGRYNQKAKINFNSNFTIAQKPDLYYSNRYLPADVVMGFQKTLFEKNAYVKQPQTYIPAYVELLLKQQSGAILSDEFGKTELQMQHTDSRSEALNSFYQPATNQQYALSTSGGETSYHYYFSAGYDSNRGTVIGNADSRLNLSLQNTFKTWKYLEMNAGIWYTKLEAKANGLSYQTASDVMEPYTRFKGEDGKALPVGTNGLRLLYQEEAIKNNLLDWLYRPIDEINLADNTSKSQELRLNGGIKYSFFKDFNLNASYQYLQNNQASRKYYSPESFFVRNLVNKFTQTNGTSPIPNNGILAGESPYEGISHSGRLQLNFQHTSTDYELYTLAGAEIKQSLASTLPGYILYDYDDNLGLGSSAYDYTKSFSIRPLGLGKISGGVGSPAYITNRYLSYFSNASYSYKSRYTVSGSLRWDGSNLLGVKTNQKGTPLWSAGASWEISREHFYAIKQMPYLRLRATYGSGGNVDKSQSYFPTIAYLVEGITGIKSANLTSPGNPYLKWEQVNTLNLGIDWGLFDRRIQGSLEGYIKKAKDLLATNLMDPTIGVTGNYKINYGGMQTKGLDLQINSQNLKGNFNWNSTFLLNYTTNKITKLNIQVSNDIGTNLGASQPEKGQSLDAVYALPWNGLDHNTGRPIIFIDGKQSYDYAKYYNTFPKADLLRVGVRVPPYYSSLLNSLKWRELELTFLITGKFGYVFSRQSMWSGAEQAVGNTSYHTDYFKRWKQPGDEAFTNVPASTPIIDSYEQSVYQFSEALISKGDYIRLQDINIAYTFQAKALTRLGLQSIRIYSYAKNLGLIWKNNKEGLDPEYANSSYPPSKSFAFGLQVNY